MLANRSLSISRRMVYLPAWYQSELQPVKFEDLKGKRISDIPAHQLGHTAARVISTDTELDNGPLTRRRLEHALEKLLEKVASS